MLAVLVYGLCSAPAASKPVKAGFITESAYDKKMTQSNANNSGIVHSADIK
jgi:hypothetical protein